MQRPKITLIGPVFPYRGGIAQYNTQLHRALQKQGPTQTISFKRLYPAFLYPGKSPIEPGAKNKREEGVDYILDAYSPFSWRRAANAAIKNKSELVVLTWWTLFWQPGMAYMARKLRKHGIKTAFICHNVVDHDAGKMKKRISAFFLRQVDAYIVHATEEAELLRELGLKGGIINMKSIPIFRHYPPAKGTLAKRGQLEILFFGFIRPYKGLQVLVDALGKLNNKEIFLTVVGEAWQDNDKLRQDLESARAPNLELHLKYVGDQEAAEYFHRADIVALPYKTATGSGVLSVAYHYHKPVLATNVGGLKDAVIPSKTGWLVEPDSVPDIMETIEEIDRKQAAAMHDSIADFCKKHSWDKLADKIYTLV